MNHPHSSVAPRSICFFSGVGMFSTTHQSFIYNSQTSISGRPSTDEPKKQTSDFFSQSCSNHKSFFFVGERMSVNLYSTNVLPIPISDSPEEK